MPLGKVIKLDIGGRVFKTTRSTLTKFDGYFKTLLESEIPPELDESGCIFINRSATHFDLILNYMRDASVGIPESDFEKDQILCEANFYDLEGLIFLCGKSQILAEDQIRKTSNVQFLTAQELNKIKGNCDNENMREGDLENVIKLDIGGTVFKTTRSTLTKFEGYFKTMLESEIPPELDESGCIFINRSATHFDLILNYMRDASVGIPESYLEKNQILHEANFYALEGLIFLCKKFGASLKSTEDPIWFATAQELNKITGDCDNKKMRGGDVPESDPKANFNVIKLDIGGTVFRTTRYTLTKFESFFKAMLESGIPLELDESGSIFIDRSPRHFGLILTYMACGNAVIPNSHFEKDQIRREANYYGLEGLMYLCVEFVTCECELNQIIKESENQNIAIISYSVKAWGDLRDYPDTVDFVNRNSRLSWRIIFMKTKDGIPFCKYRTVNPPNWKYFAPYRNWESNEFDQESFFQTVEQILREKASDF